MNDPRQIAASRNPILGPVSLALISLTTLAIVWFIIQSRIPAVGTFDLHRQEMLPSGCVYALVAAGTWLATAIHHRYARFAARAVIVIAATWLFGLLRDARPWPQSAADLSGVAVVQCMMFFWAGVPQWRTSGQWRTSETANTDGPWTRGNQFGIADLAIATTMIAILLSFVVRYSPPIQWLSYCMVSSAVWIGAACVTTLIAKGMTSNKMAPTFFFLGISLALAAAGTYAIATIDSVLDRGTAIASDVRTFVWFYGRIVWGFWLTFAFIACFARILVFEPKSQ